MKAQMKISVNVAVCSLRKSTSKAEVFKTVKFSIDWLIYSDLFSYLIYFLSNKELKGNTKFAIISDYIITKSMRAL